jgi:predicted CXXCH cytochrome family protein
LLAVAALAAAGLGVWRWLRPVPDDPRLSFPTPYRNVRPEVRYVGDAACADCHADVAAAYARHPMSRSLGPVAGVAEVERYGDKAQNPFEKDGFGFEVLHRGARRTHRARQGTTRLEADVHYAVGSGARGRTYLVERNGYLFQSPISWYSGKGRWDLTPGLEAAEVFERPARPGCLFCHTSVVEPVAHTVNRYRGAPLFRGPGIGCERCHGPGELHVATRERGEEPVGLDDTIVNPARLAPGLRDAVCEQCHLQGEVRVVRRGRELFDYRPGLPLHSFVAVFVRRPEFAEGPTVGGHAEQMQASRCFQASAGRLGCTSCHDPHSVPAPAARQAHYQARCLRCHTEDACSRPPGLHGNCIDCHMPRAGSQIAHTAVADHRIPRRPAPPGVAKPRPLRTGEVPLSHFHGEDDPRDLGLALAEVGRTYPKLGRFLGPTALPLLEAATKAHRDDVAAWEARGFVLWQLGHSAEGLAALETALALAPQRELTLSYAAVLAAARGRKDEAIGYWRRAIAVNPWSAPYHARLARLLAQRRDWEDALAECDRALRLNPFDAPTRELRAECLKRLGKA